MTLARVKTWGEEALLYTDLNGEFDNILSNALSLISPLTGTLNFNGNQATNIVPVLKTYTTAAIPSAGTAWRMFGVSDSLGGIRLDNGATMGRLLPYIDVTHPPFNARADGSTDDTAAIQAALTAGATTGVVVFFPPGTYRCSDVLTLASNNHLRGSGKGITILRWDDDDYNGIGGVITATGTQGVANALTGNAASGAVTVDVTDGSTIAAGDRLHLASADLHRGVANIYRGEIVIVASKSTNELTLTTRIFDPYTTANSAAVYPLTMLSNISIQDLTVRREAQTAAARGGIIFDKIERARIENVAVEYATERGISFIKCLDFEVAGCSVEDSFYSGTGTSYAYVVSDSARNGRFHNNYARHFRVGFEAGQSGGGAGIQGVPRLISFNNNTVAQETGSIAGGAIETHSSAEFFTINGNTIITGPQTYGIISVGSNVVISGNSIYGYGGIQVGGLATAVDSASSVLISNNNIVADGGTSAQGISVGMNHVRVVGNFITNNNAAAYIGIVVIHPTSGSILTDVQIDGNTVINATPTGASYGVEVYDLHDSNIVNNAIYRPGNNVAIVVTTRGGAGVCDNLGIFNNQMIDDQAVPTMTSGLNVAASSTNIRYGGNVILGNTGAAIVAAVGTQAARKESLLDIGGGYIDGLEMTAPDAPAANSGRIYFVDNGAGKTQLMVRFATGVAQQIAIEPP